MKFELFVHTATYATEYILFSSRNFRLSRKLILFEILYLYSDWNGYKIPSIDTIDIHTDDLFEESETSESVESNVDDQPAKITVQSIIVRPTSNETGNPFVNKKLTKRNLDDIPTTAEPLITEEYIESLGDIGKNHRKKLYRKRATQTIEVQIHAKNCELLAKLEKKYDTLDQRFTKIAEARTIHTDNSHINQRLVGNRINHIRGSNTHTRGRRSITTRAKQYRQAQPGGRQNRAHNIQSNHVARNTKHGQFKVNDRAYSYNCHSQNNTEYN